MPFHPHLIMKVAGYIKRPHPMNDYIKNDEHGRFHFINNDNDLINLHYDLNGEDCNHYSIPMPLRCEKERRRLMSIGHSLKLKHEKKLK